MNGPKMRPAIITTLRPFDPPLFHVEHAVCWSERLLVRLEGCEHELAVQTLHLADETSQAIAVEFCCGIVKQQRRNQVGAVAKHFQLRKHHRNRQKLLLPAGGDFERRTSVDPDLHVGPMRADVAHTTGAVTRKGGSERLGKRRLLVPARRVTQIGSWQRYTRVVKQRNAALR